MGLQYIDIRYSEHLQAAWNVHEYLARSYTVVWCLYSKYHILVIIDIGADTYLYLARMKQMYTSLTISVSTLPFAQCPQCVLILFRQSRSGV